MKIIKLSAKDAQDEIYPMKPSWQGDEQNQMQLVNAVKERLLAIGWDARLTSGYFQMQKHEANPMSDLKHFWVTVFEGGKPKLFVDIFNPYHHMFVIPLVHPLAKHYKPQSFGAKESPNFDLTQNEEEFKKSRRHESEKERAVGEPKVKQNPRPEGQKNQPSFIM